MPGFEILGPEERRAINKLFEEGGILFAHGFANQRKKYHVREFEKELRSLPDVKSLQISR